MTWDMNIVRKLENPSKKSILESYGLVACLSLFTLIGFSSSFSTNTYLKSYYNPTNLIIVT